MTDRSVETVGPAWDDLRFESLGSHVHQPPCKMNSPEWIKLGVVKRTILVLDFLMMHQLNS